MLHHPTLLSPFLHQTSRFSSQGMEDVALKKSKRPEAPVLLNHGVGGGGGSAELNFDWIAEATSSFFGEEFSVDDLLDFEGLDDKDIVSEEEEVVEHHHRPAEAENSKLISSPDSGLTFQPSPPTADIGLPVYHADDDEAELEWVSRIVDDSYSAIPPCEMPPLPPLKRVAVPMEPLVPVKAKRSKRPRILGASWYTSSASSSTTTTTSSSPSSSSCGSSSFSSPPPCLVYDYYPSFANTELFSPESQKHKKKRGRKPKKQQQPATEEASGGGERRCSHCGVSKTPQWRAGPMGTKTLCNACGVRFKSGRLLPEYRPACSPTFSAALHSNSHRKVLEMRNQKEQKQPAGATTAAAVPVAS